MYPPSELSLCPPYASPKKSGMPREEKRIQSLVVEKSVDKKKK
jgi:hypothetical protein